MRIRILTINLLCILIYLFTVSINAQEKELKLEILNGHSGGGVLSVAVSSDGKFALTGSTDWTALLWDLETGNQLRRFVGHSDAVSAVAFSKDGTQVLTASNDKTARLWETATGKQIRVFVENRNNVLIGHSDKILTAAFSSDGRFVSTAGEDKTARIWDAKTGTQLFLLEHEGRVNSIAFSPDSKYLLTGGEDKIARLFSTNSGELVRQFVGHTGEIMSVAYSPDGKQVLTGSMDITARLWNAETTAQITKYTQIDRQPIYTVAFTQNGKKIYAADRLYDVISGQPTGFYEHKYSAAGISGASPIYYHADAIAVSITPDERQLLIVYTNYVSVVDVVSQKEVKRLLGKSLIVNDVAFAPNLQVILTAGAEDTSGLWNIKKAQIIKLSKYKEFPTEIYSTAFSNNGEWFVSKENNSFILRDASDGKILHKLEDFGDEDSWDKPIVISADNRIILRVFAKDKLVFSSSGTGETLKSFSLDWKKNLKISEYTEAFYAVDSIALSPDNKTIAVAATVAFHKTRVDLWNAETGEVEQIIKDFLAPVWSVAFSPDGKTIATASGGEIDMQTVGIGNAMNANSVQLWDVETGKEIERFGGEFKSSSNKFAGFKSVAYSPDGKFIASGSFDGKVYLRNNETKELKKFEAHTDMVNSVKFAKDANGKLLVVSGSSDSTTRIWDAATGEEICALVTFRDGNWAVVQTKTGRYDASNGGNIEGIQWTYGNEVIELGQLSSVYYTPNLLPRLLGYNDEKLPVVIPLKDIKLHPEVISQEFEANTNKLTIKLKNRNGGIGKTEVFVNDSLVVEDARSEKLKANPNLAENEIITLEVDLSGGKFGATVCEDEEKKLNCGIKDEIKVVTSNYLKEIGRGNIQSKGSVSVRTREDKKEYKFPSLYAVVAGVSDYEGDAIDLNFAAKDAEDFSNALSLGARRLFCAKEKPDCLDKVQIKTLSTQRKELDAQPTKENIKKAFEEIALKATPEDIVVIYFSGHGVSFGDDTYLYLTKDASVAKREDLTKNFQTVAISSDELRDWLALKEWKAGEKGIKALKQVLILDTCAAGEAAKKLTLNKELSSDQIRAIEFLKDKTGTFVLMGSTADAPSYEATQFGQGLLTYSLLQAMKGAALQNERVDVRALFDYAEKQVPQLAINIGGIQKPIVSAPLGKTFVIGQMTDAEKNKIILPTPKPLMLRPSLGVPPINNDPSNLIPELRKRFDAESSYEVVRQRGGKEPILIYIDDDSFPDAVRVTGTYSVAGDKIKIKAYLVRGEKVLAELMEIEGTKEEVLDKLVEQIRKELSKTKQQ